MSWSSVRADKLTSMGKRPTNSGMRPYAVRSALSTWKCSRRHFKTKISFLEWLLFTYGNRVVTDSSKDEVTAPLVTPLVAMLARTGAPKPIDESCRLEHIRDDDQSQAEPEQKGSIVNLPIHNGLLKVNKCSSTDKEDIFCVYLCIIRIILSNKQHL